MKRVLNIANGALAAAFLLAPAAIFACPAGSNNGIVSVDSHPVADVREADKPLTSDCKTTYVHGFNVLDAEGTYSIKDGARTLSSGAWKGTRAKNGNGFDFAAGPVDLPEGSHTVKVFDSSGLADNEASKTFECHSATATGTTHPTPPPTSTPTSVPTATPTAIPTVKAGGEGTKVTGQGNAGDTWLQTVGPCPDKNAEQLNHNPNAFGNCNIANSAGAASVQPPFEPTAEAAQNAEIGTVEDTNPNHTPHLPCANIELMGKGMGDPTGAYSIDVWPPTGNMTPVYGKDAAGASVLTGQMSPGDVGHNGTWVFDAAKHQYQVMDIVDVDALIHNADLAGAHEHPIQGYHFKLQFTQDPQKHKTFWVDCPSPTQPPVVTPPPGPCTSIAQSLKSYSFSVNGGPAVQDLENNVHQGDHVSVTYATTGECSTQTFSLVSYTAPSAAFDTATAPQQQVFKFDTATAGAGTHTLAVDVPGCFFQVDFVKGSPIFHLGATPNDFYSAQGRLIDGENGGSGSCASVTPPPPAPILAIVKHVDKTTASAPANLTYTIGVTNSGNGAATNVGVVDVISPGTVQFDAPAHFFPSSGAVAVSGGHYIWTIPTIAPGAGAELTFSILARTAGTIGNASTLGAPGDTCAAPTCSAVQTVVTTPPVPGSITAVIVAAGSTTVVPGGTVQLQGITSPTGNYPATYSHLPSSPYCVQEMTPGGYSLTGATVSGTPASMATPGQVCFPLASGQMVPVVFQVSKNGPQTAPTACVGQEFMLQGTTIVVPGGTVSLNGGNNQAAPFTYCNLPLGSATGAAVTPPAGYTLVPGTQPITEILVAGANPAMLYYVNIPQPSAQCGNILGTVVLAGTTTMVPGGTITEGGQPAVTTYPALLGPCSPPNAGVAVTVTAPSGYQVVGSATATAPIVAGQVTPVVFQVRPIAAGSEGAGHGTPTGADVPTSGVLAATVQHAPASGVLGTSIGMPLTGSEAEGRIALSVVCVALGAFALYSSRRRRGEKN